MKPKPPTRPKPETKPDEEEAEGNAEARTAAGKAEGAPEGRRGGEAARQQEAADKPAKPENREGEAAEKSVKGAKPKSATRPRRNRNSTPPSISKLLSQEAPQRRAATGSEIQHRLARRARRRRRRRCRPRSRRASPPISTIIITRAGLPALSLGGATFAPIVEFHLSREGALDGRPRLINPVVQSGRAGARRTGAAGRAALQPHAHSRGIHALLRRSAA